MSIAIQLLTSLQSTVNLPVKSPQAVLAGLSRVAEQPAVLDTSAVLTAIHTTEFQRGARNARIELLANGEQSVLCYDASIDYNEMLIRQSIQAATEAAQAWVKRSY